MSNQKAGDLSTLFDIGGIFGGILAGLLSDLTGMSAVTCAGAYILTVPMVIESEFIQHMLRNLLFLFSNTI